MAPIRAEDWRSRVVDEARSWVGTPYHHLAAVKGVGVDCAMLTWSVYHALGLFEVPDPRPYPHEWHLHRSEERFLLNFETWAHRVDEPRPGDIALFRYGRTVSHSGILTSTTTMVHAYLGLGCWEESLAAADYAERLHSFWSIEP